MKIRDRIKSFRRVKASDLAPDPRNWRSHPQAQQDALRGVLAEVGIADAVLARELPDGSLMIVDGHLRADVMPDQKIPCLILDVDEAEAALILATLDPLAGMAEADPVKLAAVFDVIGDQCDAVQLMLDEITRESTAPPQELTTEEIQQREESADAGDVSENKTDSELARATDGLCPIVPRYAESHEAFVLICDNAIDEAWMRSLLKLESPRASYKDSKIRQANIITVEEFRTLLNDRDTNNHS